MSWDSKTLRGKSIERARLYGMPHAGSEYTAKTGDSYRRICDQCVICGRPSAHTHHEPPKGIGGNATFALGGMLLRPALFSLCPNCHDMRHQGRYVLTWEWADPIFEEMWSTGFLLQDYEPHDPQLYEYGCWSVYAYGYKIKEIRL